MDEVNGSAAEGFWSYARVDDARESGRILRLRHLIQDEYALLTGSEIRIFVDQKDISWGDGFRDVLNEALGSTTFFIPVLTETYFQREECRREFKKFVDDVRALGLDGLLLSIRYAPIADLREDSPDALKVIASSIQFEPWESLRLEDEDSAAYRRGVSRLAQRLADLAAEFETRLPLESGATTVAIASDGLPRDEDALEVDAPGVLDAAADIPERIQSWTASIQGVGQAMVSLNAEFDGANRDLREASSGPNQFATRVQIARRLARAVEEPLANLELHASRYTSELETLDPLVRVLIAGTTLGIEHGDPISEANRQGLLTLRGMVSTSEEAMVKWKAQRLRRVEIVG